MCSTVASRNQVQNKFLMLIYILPLNIIPQNTYYYVGVDLRLRETQRIILFSLLSSLIFLIKIKTNMSQVITEVEQNLVSVQQGF